MTNNKTSLKIVVILLGLIFSRSVVARPTLHNLYLTQQVENLSTESKRSEALSLTQKGWQLFQQGTAKSLQQAIVNWETALTLWRELGDLKMEAMILNNIGAVYRGIGQPKQALAYYQQVLPIARQLREIRGEATTLNNIGLIYADIGEPEQALTYYQQALPILRQVKDRKTEATVLNNTGAIYRDIGQSEQALAYYQQALPILRQVGDRKTEAIIYSNIGVVRRDTGQLEQALAYYQQALLIFRQVRDKRGEAATLNNIGTIHRDTGQPEQALAYYQQALLILRQAGDRKTEAATLNNIGLVYGEMGQLEKALAHYLQALPILRQVRDKRGEAATLNNIGVVYSKIGQPEQALAHYQQALPVLQQVGDKGGEATTFNNIGWIYGDIGEPEQALAYYQQALPILRQVGDIKTEAITLNNIASLEKERKNLTKALNNIQASIKILETIRGEITDSDLRTSYFASVNDYYQLYIDILMELHQQNPNDGYDKQALEVSEQARARTLLELIKEGDIVRGINPQLKQRKENLEQQIIARTQAIQILAEKGQQEQIESIQQEINRLENQIQTVEAEIRQQNPEYARLTQTKLNLSTADIQQKIVDRDTILLSYWLGEEQSYLWLVTPDEITSYILPPQAEIERASQEFLDYAQDAGHWDLYPKKARAGNQKLSQMLLAPVADKIANKRLIVVADGGLQYLPFSLLENPQTNQSLIAANELVNLPSASTLDAIRNKTNQPPVNRKEIAIFAHPVFTSGDRRLPNKPQLTTSNEPETIEDLVRKQALAGAILNPLPGTEATAQQILAYIPGNDSKKLNLGFDANRQAIFDSAVSQYRLIHLGTHGLFNKTKPEHSGIVLSLYNEQGNYQADGMLLITEVFNLNLPADLVVLAACNTVEGEEIKGEGIVGITRGLMYAGAERVVMTLWDVDDDATTVFMSRFYQEMLENKLTPAAALRATQLWMQTESEYQAPDYWAGFVLQGEWHSRS